MEGLRRQGDDWRVLLLPDHATPIAIKTHSSDPVPFAIMGKGIMPDAVERFDEESAKRGGYGLVEATELVGMMMESVKMVQIRLKLDFRAKRSFFILQNYSLWL